jgi:ASTRA-associated protein 1
MSVPTPSNILRGHKAQIHAAAFLRGNERLATGDADGYVTLWDLAIMRPRAVWKAHESALLAVRGWGADRVITHGRDHKLIVWKLGVDDEERMSTALPVEDVATRPQPWMLHLLPVNTMNFCAFGSCEQDGELLIAVPHSLESESVCP